MPRRPAITVPGPERAVISRPLAALQMRAAASVDAHSCSPVHSTVVSSWSLTALTVSGSSASAPRVAA